LQTKPRRGVFVSSEAAIAIRTWQVMQDPNLLRLSAPLPRKTNPTPNLPFGCTHRRTLSRSAPLRLLQ
jgi:hypothetical protein